MKKIILRIVAFFAILICCFPTTIHAANVARVESTGVEYTTLQAAIDAADANGDTVTLLADITLAAADYVKIIDRSIIIDGGNFSITHNSDMFNNVAVYVKAINRNVTLKNLNIYDKNAENGIVVTEKCNLTLENVEVSGGAGPGVPYRALFFNANTGYSTVNITNSKLEGNYAMSIFGEYMTINVNNSNIISKDDSDTEDFAAIILHGYDDYYHTNGTVVNVTGGSVVAYKENNITLSNAVINASATGQVNFDVTTIEGNFANPVAVAGVSESNYEYFYSLQDAIDDAKDSTKVVNVLRDLNESVSIVVDGKSTINGNGYTLTSTADEAIVINTTEEVKINNYKIIGKTGHWGIAVKNQMALLKLDKVTVSVDNGCAIFVDLTGTAGTKVYAENSDLSGLSAIALWSNGSGAQFTNTKLTGVCEKPAGGGSDYGVIDIFSADNVTVKVYGGVISATTQADKEKLAVACITSVSNNAIVYLDNATTIQLNGTATIVNVNPLDNPSITLSAQYRQQLNNEGYGVNLPPDANGLVQINYAIEIFEVKYIAEGTTVAVFGVQDGANVASPPVVPAKAGYTGAWNHDGTNIEADTTITAVYTKATPETGDNKLDVWTKIMLISGLGVILTAAYGKKKKII